MFLGAFIVKNTGRNALSFAEGVRGNSVERSSKVIDVSSSRGYICESCSRAYKARSGLWKHAQKCQISEKIITEKSPTSVQEQIVGLEGNSVERSSNEFDANMLSIIYDLVKQNQEIKEMLLKQNEMMMVQRPSSIIQQQIIHNHNTTNNHLNINLFLQEKCKYAMNINEFVDNLTVQMGDLEMVGRLGFVEGISRIIINGLRSLDVYSRPIHCTDTKRETIYIRERDEWTRDTESKEHTKRAIARVANKNLNKIPEWKRLHPETDIFESNAYNTNMQIMVQSLGGIGGTSAEKTARNQDKIWKRIMPEVTVDKKALLTFSQ